MIKDISRPFLVLFVVSVFCFAMTSIAEEGEWAVTASSNLIPQLGNTYEAEKICDGLIETAWVEGAPGYGVGEYVDFRLDIDWGPGAYVSGFTIFNGYCKSEESWTKNSRVKVLKIFINDNKFIS